MNEPDPFEDSGVFVDDFALFEVEALAGFGVGGGDEGLVQIDGVEDVVLEPEKTVDGGAQEFGVP